MLKTSFFRPGRTQGQGARTSHETQREETRNRRKEGKGKKIYCAWRGEGKALTRPTFIGVGELEYKHQSGPLGAFERIAVGRKFPHHFYISSTFVGFGPEPKVLTLI